MKYLRNIAIENRWVIDPSCFIFNSFEKFQPQPSDISKGVQLIEMTSTDAGETRKQSRTDTSITGIEFYSSTMKEITYTFHQ